MLTFARSVPAASHVAYTALVLVLALLVVVLALWANRERQVRRLQREVRDLRRYVVHLDEADRLAAVAPQSSPRTRHLAAVVSVATPVRGLLCRARAHPVIASLAAIAVVLAITAAVLAAPALGGPGAVPDVAAPRPEEPAETPEPRRVDPPRGTPTPTPTPTRATREAGAEAVTRDEADREVEPSQVPQPRTTRPHDRPSPTPTPRTTAPHLPKVPERIPPPGPPAPPQEPRALRCAILVCVRIKL